MGAQTRSYAITICDACINLQGEQCHTPECVFCWRTMKEVGEYLDVLLIRPRVDGKRFEPEYAFSLAGKEQCPQCGSLERNICGRECRSKPFDPIHYRRDHPWHQAEPGAAPTPEP